MKLLKTYLRKIGVYKEVRKLKKFTLELWTFWGGLILLLANAIMQINFQDVPFLRKQH